MSTKDDYEKYIGKLRAQGVKLTEYECVDCKTMIQTRAAPKGEYWDTASACPHCNELHFKYTIGDYAYAAPFPA